MDEVIAIATAIGEEYAILGGELGAQWYDLCTQLAGIQAEPAELSPLPTESIQASANAAAANAANSTIGDVFSTFLSDVINNSIRETGRQNLWRDYERGLTAGRWARVPVGDTCAFCLMLASQGAWYLTEESALGESADHYHRKCDCKAVYHASPEDIRGYKDLARYKQMYYSADNARIANNSGKTRYPEELERRITQARANHEAIEDKKAEDAKANGETYKKIPWTNTNTDLIIMRFKYNLK